MSRDDCIAILITKDSHKQITPCAWENMWEQGIIAYRVACIQGADNLEWLEQNEPYNAGVFMDRNFSDVPIFYDKERALNYAYQLDEQLWTEYGVIEIERLNYKFPI